MNRDAVTPDQIERIRLGEMAKNFLDSPEWKEILKPIITSMLIGIKDITEINLSSEENAMVEFKSRKLAAQYLQDIEVLVDGYVVDANIVAQILDKKRGDKSLYKKIEKVS